LSTQESPADPANLLWQTEVVAGSLSRGTDPERAIRQEINEETGCKISDLQLRHTFFANPALLRSRVYLYFAIVSELPASRLRGRKDEDEDICLVTMDTTEAIERLRTGQFHNALTMLAIGLFALDRNRSKSPSMLNITKTQGSKQGHEFS
jgi:ADP-ribose pyrophosphatase